ncbi:hypothetical protein [Alkalihalobacillus sp. AL-G]|uniref:hypothetical protein n=1 Tax=Alkalihalobacillus sp. AL-G TaxID=2926399 RepID=UPI00272D5792|nr:hypothetical protein [Alkalihalobacillus sp. AL-G]WLD92174.1 hypothetical protein MOJ78_14230 [Alkalihalobacillus sp. AL-G]
MANTIEKQLRTSGDIREAPLLHKKRFNLEVLRNNNEWEEMGELSFFKNTAFLNNEKLYNVHYHKPTNSVVYSFDKDIDHRSGRLFFTENKTAFIGSLIDDSGNTLTVRGTNYSTVFLTKRRLKSHPDQPLVDWVQFKIVNKWEDGTNHLEASSPILHTYYYLGNQDVSERTAVTHVDPKTWNTTIEMTPSLGPFGDSDSFQIVIPCGTKGFSGTYDDGSGTEYDWSGNADTPSFLQNLAHPNDYAEHDHATTVEHTSPSMFSTLLRSKVKTGPSKSIQDLNSISSIYEVEDKDGNKKTIDFAQSKTGELLNYCMINAEDPKWVNEIFGHPYNLETSGVKNIFNEHTSFFKDHSTMAIGQLLYDNLSNTDQYKEDISKIQPDKLKEAWEKLSESKTYCEVSQKLYIEGYKINVPGIQPYLEDNPKAWAKQYFEFLTDHTNLSIWQAQISSHQFANIKQQMYEWYVKLSVLDDETYHFTKEGKVLQEGTANQDDEMKATYGQQMLNIAYGAILGVAYNKVRWNEDIGPFLQKIIENGLSGDISDLTDDMIKQSVEEQRKIFNEMISTFDNVQNFMDNVIQIMTIWANKNPNSRMTDASENLYESLTELFDERSTNRKIWDGFKEKGPKALGMLLYGAAAGYLIYSIVEDAKHGDLTPAKIIQDIGLGMLSLGLLVKGTQALMSIGLGDWLRIQSLKRTGFLAETAGSISKWFTKEGFVAENTLGKVFTKIFGESYTEFFAKRLGPAMAVFGIVMASVWLYKSIVSGAIKEIVFEALNLFFALADAVFIGLELMSFAWAGPVGLVIAGIGIIVALVQLIWGLVDPPKPPKDPIQQYIADPLKAKGFAV